MRDFSFAAWYRFSRPAKNVAVGLDQKLSLFVRLLIKIGSLFRRISPRRLDRFKWNIAYVRMSDPSCAPGYRFSRPAKNEAVGLDQNSSLFFRFLIKIGSLFRRISPRRPDWFEWNGAYVRMRDPCIYLSYQDFFLSKVTKIGCCFRHRTPRRLERFKWNCVYTQKRDPSCAPGYRFFRPAKNVASGLVQISDFPSKCY